MFKKIILDNNTTLLMHPMQGVRSVCLGIWVKVGSRDEAAPASGISHFLEHMFFKGTQARSAKDLAVDMDSMGGDLNAFTSKEGTTYYIKVLDEYLEKGIELLSDMFLNSSLPEDEIQKEKGVINEEIKMVEDTPEDYVYDLFSASVWGGGGGSGGLDRPILGNSDTIGSFTRADLLGHVERHYGTKDTVIACAGSFDEAALLGHLNKYLGPMRAGEDRVAASTPVFRPGINIIEKDYSEAHICLGVKGIAQSSQDRYTLSLLNTVLGAGMSSRLFQEIRENRGLVYSIHSSMSSYADTGSWLVYAGTSPQKAAEVIGLTVGLFKDLPDSVTLEELDRAKKQLKGNLILGLESSGSIMQHIARQEIYYGRYYSPEEIMKQIDSITLNDAREISSRMAKESEGMALTVLGPVEEAALKSALPPL